MIKPRSKKSIPRLKPTTTTEITPDDSITPIVLKRQDGALVNLECPICESIDFETINDFINHTDNDTRYHFEAEVRDFLISHPENLTDEFGKLLPIDEQPYTIGRAIEYMLINDIDPDEYMISWLPHRVLKQLKYDVHDYTDLKNKQQNEHDFSHLKSMFGKDQQELGLLLNEVVQFTQHEDDEEDEDDDEEEEEEEDDDDHDVDDEEEVSDDDNEDDVDEEEDEKISDDDIDVDYENVDMEVDEASQSFVIDEDVEEEIRQFSADVDLNVDSTSDLKEFPSLNELI
ncbi:hypothetical protein CANARDRAFT_177665 [[Candida] arabinofermentans NRRL YB-2248]|uniref:Uncharacterized protein n=1 Tax=[Candida] arabinofermentans NRRL YB-2248 TaxID=983967 RepID=A0A1E4SVR1_9ASCO|nr:hypothetical protein CANARDRAFT_177665 [[Candida] arabinofermentans NRRL YB-2248]